MHTGYALDSGNSVEQQLLECIHVFDRHLHLIVSGLTGDQEALHDFRDIADLRIEIFKALRRMLVHGNVNQGEQRQAQRFRIDMGAISGNQARFFHGLNPPQAG